MPDSVCNAPLDSLERIRDSDLPVAEASLCKHPSAMVRGQVRLSDHGPRKARKELAILSLCLHDSSVFLCIHDCIPHAGQLLLDLDSRLQIKHDYGISGLFQPIQAAGIEQA